MFLLLIQSCSCLCLAFLDSTPEDISDSTPEDIKTSPNVVYVSRQPIKPRHNVAYNDVILATNEVQT